MKFKAYALIARAIEEGIECGLHCAHKHTEMPTREMLAEHIEREIMNALDLVLDFDDEGDDGN